MPYPCITESLGRAITPLRDLILEDAGLACKPVDRNVKMPLFLMAEPNRDSGSTGDSSEMSDSSSEYGGSFKGRDAEMRTIDGMDRLCQHLFSPREKNRRFFHSQHRQRASKIHDMPMDVLAEMMKHLTPFELLQLSRTDQTLRGFLMNRSAKLLWRAAGMNVPGLPDCPDHLCEPEFAALAFDRECDRCNVSEVWTTYWAFGARYCWTCRDVMTIECESQRSCRFGETCDTLVIPHVHDSEDPRIHFHHSPDVLKLNREERSSQQEYRDALVKKCIRITAFASRCEEWDAARQAKRDNVRLRRFKAILEELRAIPSAEAALDSLKPSYQVLIAQQGVDEAEDLNELARYIVLGHLARGLRASREGIIEHRVNILFKRLKTFAAVYTEWWREQPRAATLPRPIELMDRSEVHEIIEQDSYISVDRVDLLPLKEHFGQWAEGWRVQKDGELRALLCAIPGLSGLEEGTDLLELACAAFDCSFCSGESTSTRVIPPLYPSLLGHECLYKEADDPHGTPFEIAAQSATRDAYSRSVRLKWSSLPLTVDVWHARAVEIIRACGKNPYVTTRKDMDVLRIRLWCECCDEQPDENLRKVFRWRDCFQHYLHHDLKTGGQTLSPYSTEPEGVDFPVKWRAIADPDLISSIESVEALQKTLVPVEHRCSGNRISSCIHCQGLQLKTRPWHATMWQRYDARDESLGPTDYLPPDMELAFSRPVWLIRRNGFQELSERGAKMLQDHQGLIFDF